MTDQVPALVSETLTPIDPSTYDRSKRLGGSDIAAVIGKSPWKTPLQLYLDKITPRIEQRPVTGVKRRGLRWEGVVGEMLVEALEEAGHTVEIVSANKRYADPEHPYLAAEIDWELRLDGNPDIVNCELKTVHPFAARDWGESGGEECPVHYTAQVVHGLGVTRRKRGILAALFGADELRAYPIEADAALIAWLREQAVAFWTNHVLAGVPPEPMDTIEDVLRRFPLDGEGAPLLLQDSDPMVDTILRLRAVRAEINAREAEADALQVQVMRAMRDCTELVMPNGKKAIDWKQRSGSWLDETALKEAHPKVYREFQRKWDKRVFVFKSFDTKGLV